MSHKLLIKSLRRPRKMVLSNVTFIKSGASREDWISDNTKEIVLLGRSNVGKSTFINTLTGQSSLAKVSSHPGKTRLLNFFDVAGKYRIVDAPGYGYAGASKKEVGRFGLMVSDYLSNRENLAGALFLLDSRRIPNGDDLNIFDILNENKTPFVIIATKYDKLNQSERARLDRNIRGELGLPETVEIVHTTNTNRLWVNKIITKLNELVK